MSPGAGGGGVVCHKHVFFYFTSEYPQLKYNTWLKREWLNIGLTPVLDLDIG